MSSIYKIETHSEPSANMVEEFIISMGGKCVVLGSAVITNFGFDSGNSLSLLPFISGIHDQITDNDLYHWAESH